MTTKRPSKTLECISLRPTEEEAEIIWDAVRECKLEESGAGVLQLLMALLTSEEEAPPSNPIFQHFKENPEDLQVVSDVAKTAIASILKRIRQ